MQLARWYTSLLDSQGKDSMSPGCATRVKASILQVWHRSHPVATWLSCLSCLLPVLSLLGWPGSVRQSLCPGHHSSLRQSPCALPPSEPSFDPFPRLAPHPTPCMPRHL